MRERLARMLGDRTELKELYVERLCLCLERWLRPPLRWDAPTMKGHVAAAEAIEEEVRRRDPTEDILRWMKEDGDGRLQPCSHKALRRYDIIVSSIGCGRWRGAMPMRGTDGFERADLVAGIASPIEAWARGSTEASCPEGYGAQAVRALGERDETKVFLASLLASILRAQERFARERAHSRVAPAEANPSPTG